MAVSAEYLEYVLDRLSDVGAVTSRRMFGGAGLYCDGLFFAVLDNDSLYFKVGDSNRAEYEHAGAQPFQPFGDDNYSMSYFEVPADVLESDAVRDWAVRAVAVAAAAKKSKRRNPDAPPKRTARAKERS